MFLVQVDSEQFEFPKWERVIDILVFNSRHTVLQRRNYETFFVLLHLNLNLTTFRKFQFKRNTTKISFSKGIVMSKSLLDSLIYLNSHRATLLSSSFTDSN